MPSPAGEVSRTCLGEEVQCGMPKAAGRGLRASQWGQCPMGCVAHAGAGKSKSGQMGRGTKTGSQASGVMGGASDRDACRIL